MDITQTKAYKAGWQDFMTGQQLSRKGTSSFMLQFANRYMWAANAHSFNNWLDGWTAAANVGKQEANTINVKL